MALKFGGTSTGMMSKEFRQIFVNLFWESDDPPVQQQLYGRLPIAVHYHKRVIKYWLKLIKHDHDSLIYKCHQLQLSMDKQNRSCWATGVNNLFFRNGLVMPRYIRKQEMKWNS